MPQPPKEPNFLVYGIHGMRDGYEQITTLVDTYEDAVETVTKWMNEPFVNIIYHGIWDLRNQPPKVLDFETVEEAVTTAKKVKRVKQ